MNLKKISLSILLAFILSNVLTTLWYMVSDTQNLVSFRREEMNYIGLIFNHLIYASLFVTLFSSYFQKSPKLLRGFYYGILMSAIMFVPSGIVVRSIWTVDFNQIFLWNCLAHLVIGGAMGLVVAVIYNYKNKKNETYN